MSKVVSSLKYFRRYSSFIKAMNHKAKTSGLSYMLCLNSSLSWIPNFPDLLKNSNGLSGPLTKRTTRTNVQPGPVEVVVPGEASEQQKADSPFQLKAPTRSSGRSTANICSTKCGRTHCPILSVNLSA